MLAQACAALGRIEARLHHSLRQWQDQASFFHRFLPCSCEFSSLTLVIVPAGKVSPVAIVALNPLGALITMLKSGLTY